MQVATASRPRLAFDMTDANLEKHLGSVRSSGGIHVAFQHVKVQISTADAGRNGQYETRLCVFKQPIGDRSTVAARFITEEDAAKHFPQQYRHFCDTGEVPTTGTPLHELPGISMSQIGILVLNGIRSIEDLVSVGPDQIGQLGLEAIRARKTAEVWDAKRQAARETISAADVEARMQLQLKAMQDQLERQTKSMQELTAQNAALSKMAGVGADKLQALEAPIAVDSDEDNLPSTFAEMPDVFGSGPDTADDDDLGHLDDDIDPLGEDT